MDRGLGAARYYGSRAPERVPLRFADPDRSAISNRGPMGRPPIADLGQEIGHPTMDRRPGANRLLWIAAMERPLLLITGLTANRFVVREPAGLPAELDCGHGGESPLM